jgi:hypothetical protein
MACLAKSRTEQVLDTKFQDKVLHAEKSQLPSAVEVSALKLRGYRIE